VAAEMTKLREQHERATHGPIQGRWPTMQRLSFPRPLDAGAFAERVLRRPLWTTSWILHVVRLVTGGLCWPAGGQVHGAVHAGAVRGGERRNITVLLVSAGEVASRRLLEECTHWLWSLPWAGVSWMSRSLC